MSENHYAARFQPHITGCFEDHDAAIRALGMCTATLTEARNALRSGNKKRMARAGSSVDGLLKAFACEAVRVAGGEPIPMIGPFLADAEVEFFSSQGGPRQ